jgi:hypothetical protein
MVLTATGPCCPESTPLLAARRCKHTRDRQGLRRAAVGHGPAAAAAAPDLLLRHCAVGHALPAVAASKPVQSVQKFLQRTAADREARQEVILLVAAIPCCPILHGPQLCHTIRRDDGVQATCAACQGTPNPHLCSGDGLPPLLPPSCLLALAPPAGDADRLRYIELLSAVGRGLPLEAPAAGPDLVAVGAAACAGSFAARPCFAAACSSVLMADLAGCMASTSMREGPAAVAAYCIQYGEYL